MIFMLTSYPFLQLSFPLSCPFLLFIPPPPPPPLPPLLHNPPFMFFFLAFHGLFLSSGLNERKFLFYLKIFFLYIFYELFFHDLTRSRRSMGFHVYHIIFLSFFFFLFCKRFEVRLPRFYKFTSKVFFLVNIIRSITFLLTFFLPFFSRLTALWLHRTWIFRGLWSHEKDFHITNRNPRDLFINPWRNRREERHLYPNSHPLTPPSPSLLHHPPLTKVIWMSLKSGCECLAIPSSARSLVRLLRTARFARALRYAHPFACSLTHSLPSS